MYDNLNRVTSDFEGKAKNLDYDSRAWIFKAKSIENHPILTKTDTVVANLPNTEKIKLKKRFSDIIPDNAVKYVREYDDQFLEAMVEILGWSWLNERHSRYTPFFTMGTPDLLVKDNSGYVIAAMECKKIRSSDEDRDYYKNKQGTVQKVKDSLTSSDHDKNPFLRKLMDTLSNAKKQVDNSDALEKFIFLDLTFDTQLSFPVLREPIICEILRIASELCKDGVRLVSFEQFQMEHPITGGRLP